MSAEIKFDPEKESEKTFGEIMEQTSKSIEGIINVCNYWRKRCMAAEDFIEKSPTDPDITPPQIEAYNNWQQIKETGL